MSVDGSLTIGPGRRAGNLYVLGQVTVNLRRRVAVLAQNRAELQA